MKARDRSDSVRELEEADRERQFRLLADNAPVMIWRSGPDRLCDWFNKPWLDFTGRTIEQELGNGWAEGVHPDDRERCFQTYGAAFDARQPFSMEYRLRRHDGAYRWLLDNGRPYFRDDGSFAGYFGSCIDVTDHREVEEELRRALREKEALLQELHHRVKNNMQLILSLLRLQGSRARDPELQRQLEESAARVHSIALAQAQIYQSESLAEVDIGEYLRRLCASLATVYGREGIDLVTEAERVPVAVQRAVPLGLVAGELIANALQHAFPAGRTGRVTVSVSRDGARGRLTVADDGRGMPAGLYPGGGGLGFQLVAGLAAQSGARVAVESDAGGSRWSVDFPAA